MKLYIVTCKKKCAKHKSAPTVINKALDIAREFVTKGYNVNIYPKG